MWWTTALYRRARSMTGSSFFAAAGFLDGAIVLVVLVVLPALY